MSRVSLVQDDMLEVDENDEDDESGPNPEEARREREWVAYEGELHCVVAPFPLC